MFQGLWFGGENLFSLEGSVKSLACVDNYSRVVDNTVSQVAYLIVLIKRFIAELEDAKSINLWLGCFQIFQREVIFLLGKSPRKTLAVGWLFQLFFLDVFLHFCVAD